MRGGFWPGKARNGKLRAMAGRARRVRVRFRQRLDVARGGRAREGSERKLWAMAGRSSRVRVRFGLRLDVARGGRAGPGEAGGRGKRAPETMLLALPEAFADASEKISGRGSPSGAARTGWAFRRGRPGPGPRMPDGAPGAGRFRRTGPGG